MIFFICVYFPSNKISVSIPAAIASSAAYWINGLSTIGTLGIALAGKKRVRYGKTAFFIFWNGLVNTFSLTSSVWLLISRISSACLLKTDNSVNTCAFRNIFPDRSVHKQLSLSLCLYAFIRPLPTFSKIVTVLHDQTINSNRLVAPE